MNMFSDNERCYKGNGIDDMMACKTVGGLVAD